MHSRSTPAMMFKLPRATKANGDFMSNLFLLFLYFQRRQDLYNGLKEFILTLLLLLKLPTLFHPFVHMFNINRSEFK